MLQARWHITAAGYHPQNIDRQQQQQKKANKRTQITSKHKKMRKK
jgi:hypothetical protein